MKNILIHPFMTEADIIQKPVHWFAEQINDNIDKNFHAAFLNSDRRRLYVVEEKLQQFLLLNITTLVKFTLFSSTCSVTCHIFFS